MEAMYLGQCLACGISHQSGCWLWVWLVVCLPLECELHGQGLDCLWLIDVSGHLQQGPLQGWPK